MIFFNDLVDDLLDFKFQSRNRKIKQSPLFGTHERFLQIVLHQTIVSILYWSYCIWPNFGFCFCLHPEPEVYKLTLHYFLKTIFIQKQSKHNTTNVNRSMAIGIR